MSREIVKGIFKIIGTEKERDLFLKLFQSERPEEFAIIDIDSEILIEHFSLIAWDLAFLSRLDLTPIIVLHTDTALEKSMAKKLAKVVKELEGNVSYFSVKSMEGLNYQLSKNLIKRAREGVSPMVHLHGKVAFKKMLQPLYELIITSARPRKCVFMQKSKGILYKNKTVIDYLEITEDCKNLLERKLVTQATFREILNYRKFLLAMSDVGRKGAVQVCSAEGLLKELFTTVGSGTYLNLPNPIKVLQGYRDIDKPKLIGLIEDGFGLSLKKKISFSNRDTVLLGGTYVALALLKPFEKILYLDKFVVLKERQAEGWGQSLWREILSLETPFFWRTRKNNPMQTWYYKVCDGHQKQGDWIVFWKGVSDSYRKRILKYCEEREDSFIRN